MDLLPQAKPGFIFQGLDSSCWSKCSPSQEKRALLLSPSPLQVAIQSSGFIDEVIC